MSASYMKRSNYKRAFVRERFAWEHFDMKDIRDFFDEVIGVREISFNYRRGEH